MRAFRPLRDAHADGDGQRGPHAHGDLPGTGEHELRVDQRLARFGGCVAHVRAVSREKERGDSEQREHHPGPQLRVRVQQPKGPVLQRQQTGHAPGHVVKDQPPRSREAAALPVGGRGSAVLAEWGGSEPRVVAGAGLRPVLAVLCEEAARDACAHPFAHFPRLFPHSVLLGPEAHTFDKRCTGFS